MAFLYFYSGKTLSFVKDLSSDIGTFSFTIGLNGSVKGTVTVQSTSANASFIQSLRENSHFIKFGLSKTYGGVIESAKLDSKSGMWTFTFIGAFEYLDKVDAIASHKAVYTSGSASSDDYSWIKVFYSDSSVGVLYEVLLNLTQSITARGYSASLINFGSLLGAIQSNPSVDWARSYRLNSMEAPTMQSVINDILTDDGMQLFRIRVDSNPSLAFAFILEIVSSASVINISEAVNNAANISSDGGNVQRRAFSLAKGTDLQDRTVLERVGFDSNVAYSTLITDAPQERSNSINRTAASSATSASVNFGNLTFDSTLDTIDPLDYINIGSSLMPTVSGIVTEKAVDGIKISYTIQVGGANAFNGALVKPSDEGRRIIFNPLNSTQSLSQRTAGRQVNSTGWRS